MEVYFEQSVENPKIENNKTRILVLSVIKNTCLTLAILGGLILLMFLDVSAGTVAIVLNLAFNLLIISPFIVFYIVLRRYLVKFTIEYDYILNGSIFRIVKVIKRKKRRLFIELNFSQIELMSKVDSENYERYESTPNIKKKYAIINYENPDIYFTICNQDSKILLHWEPNEGMVRSFRMTNPRIILEKKN